MYDKFFFINRKRAQYEERPRAASEEEMSEPLSDIELMYTDAATVSGVLFTENEVLLKVQGLRGSFWITCVRKNEVTQEEPGAAAGGITHGPNTTLLSYIPREDHTFE